MGCTTCLVGFQFNLAHHHRKGEQKEWAAMIAILQGPKTTPLLHRTERVPSRDETACGTGQSAPQGCTPMLSSSCFLVCRPRKRRRERPRLAEARLNQQVLSMIPIFCNGSWHTGQHAVVDYALSQPVSLQISTQLLAKWLPRDLQSSISLHQAYEA